MSKPVFKLLWNAEDRSKGDQQVLLENSIFIQKITNPLPVQNDLYKIRSLQSATG